ncbi:MAG: RidA family protein [Anaerolineaceae bacterium]|nr:MAG: RidA family protein [Anaerolineaceae bacterium]
MINVEKEIINHVTKRRGNVVLRRWKDLLFIGGHGPEDEVTGDPFYVGKLGSDLSVEDGYKAARICGEILISAMDEYLGNLDKVDYIVKAFALVSSDPQFYEQEKVMDGFSDLMVRVFGDRGLHARSVMGTSNLPGNIPVEIELIVKIKD